MALNEATDTLETDTVKTGGGTQVGQSATDLVGFWGVAPCVQPAALTAQLTTITPADAAGSADYAIAAVTSTTPFGFSNAAEAITLLYVIKNLQVRQAEIEARLEACGIVAAN